MGKLPKLWSGVTLLLLAGLSVGGVGTPTVQRSAPDLVITQEAEHSWTEQMEMEYLRERRAAVLTAPTTSPRTETRASRQRAGRGAAKSTVRSGSTSSFPVDAWRPWASARNQVRLRGCEGAYSSNTGNGFFGAYQFDLPTWRGQAGTLAERTWNAKPQLVHLSKRFSQLARLLPHQAPPWAQDAVAWALWMRRGYRPWPGCRASLGLP